MKKLKTIKLQGKEFEGYFLDELGNIYSEIAQGSRLDLGKLKKRGIRKLKCMKSKAGYLQINLRRRNTKYLHELMLETFIGPRPKGFYALHRDDNKTNNRIDNLYWGTPKENMADMTRNGKRNDCKGINKPACKLSERAVVEIYSTPKHPGYLVGLKKKFRVSFQTIYDIRNSVFWKHITSNLIQNNE